MTPGTPPTRLAVDLVLALAALAAPAAAQTLELGSAVQPQGSYVVDSSNPPKLVGQAIFTDHDTLMVVLRYGECPVPLYLDVNGELYGVGRFTTRDCSGTPRIAGLRPPSGTYAATCGLFMVNSEREVYRIYSNAPGREYRFRSYLQGDGNCRQARLQSQGWDPEPTPVAHLDDLGLTFPLRPVFSPRLGSRGQR